MSSSTYFVQECPTCGRNLQVRVSYLGKAIVCQHCGSQFAACTPEASAVVTSGSGLGLLQRADELLATAERERVRPR